MSSAAWESILIVTGINVMVALGVYVTLLAGQISLAHAALSGIGGYASVVAMVNFHWMLPVALVLGTVIAALAGMLIGALTAKMDELVVGLVTIGVAEGLVVVANNWNYIGASRGFMAKLSSVSSAGLVAVTLTVVVYVAWRFDISRLGLAARAVRDGGGTAASAGVPIWTLKVVTFALGGAFAGLAGAVGAQYFLVVSPNDMGFYMGLQIAIFVLVGGSYTLAGPIVGTVVFTILPELLRFSSDSRLILYGALVVVVVVVRPYGIVTRGWKRAPTRYIHAALRGPRAGSRKV